MNNFTNALIRSRDGGSANVQNNVTTAQASWFVNPDMGDLHLASAISTVVDQGQMLADVTEDIDCEARSQGRAYDIGADERR